MPIIKVQTDQFTSMAKVSLDDKVIMEGNFHDFHPGCHGIHTYGNFKGHIGLSTAIWFYLLRKKKFKYQDITIIGEKYTYSEVARNKN